MYNSTKEGNDYDAIIRADCVRRKLRQRKWRFGWIEATSLSSLRKERQTKVILKAEERWPPYHNYPREEFSSRANLRRYYLMGKNGMHVFVPRDSDFAR